MLSGMYGRVIWAVTLTLVLAPMVGAQAQDQQKQDIPDAPSATRPPQSFPNVPPTARPTGPPPNQAPPSGANPSSPPPASEPGAEAPPPPLKIRTVPEGGATAEADSAQEQLYTLTRNVNQVVVPVTVKDDSGRLVSGLLPRDFSLYEDGNKQTLNFFTADPSVLSAAVIFDLGMPDVAVQKVNQTLPALEGAFSQFDEVSVYTYSSSVAKVSDFTEVGKKLTDTLNEIKNYRGRNNGPAVLGGPLGPQGPTINGVPVDPSTPVVITPAKESHVLNDALLAAAVDLSKRDRAHRKVIFIVSDGREYRSSASYRDTLRVLLSHGVLVYGVAVDSSAIPGYSKLEKLHLPHMGYSDILPKYANATGGEIFPGFSRDAIESVYAHALGDARNQYTLGYLTHASPSSVHREIEVRVARPDLKVTAKEGYYPVGLAR